MPGDEESMSDEAIWETLPVSFINLKGGWILLVILANFFSSPLPTPHLFPTKETKESYDNFHDIVKNA